MIVARHRLRGRRPPSDLLNGNIDDPQFKWLESGLKEATEAKELVVLFSHHAIPSLNARA